MLTIDGANGEGGGQILRTSLALSLITGEPFRMIHIRSRRAKPGLMRQHLTAVEAAAAVSSATVSGANLGSTDITFHPGTVRGGDYAFSVGTAGSATLVLQTVLPALCIAEERSTLVLEGGTHNPLSPPFDFLARAWMPLVRRMGPRIDAVLERPGFYPAGGGRFRVTVDPAKALSPIDLIRRGAIRSRLARAVVSSLPKSIAERELGVIGERLGWEGPLLRCELVSQARGPGNVVMIEIESDHVTEVLTGFGIRGERAETVAEKVAAEAAAYLEAGVPVGVHLADQLLLPFAMAGGGSFRTLEPSSHTKTQADVIRTFLGCEIRMERIDPKTWHLEVSSEGRPS
ncbi:MAG TPA: RNA 3'-terminal phosphate cyclase [Kofleriaceae bacterium]|nr:RNA 3'-terminal phosphate cyclase [Kofleriaceae bacterium]